MKNASFSPLTDDLKSQIRRLETSSRAAAFISILFFLKLFVDFLSLKTQLDVCELPWSETWRIIASGWNEAKIHRSYSGCEVWVREKGTNILISTVVALLFAFIRFGIRRTRTQRLGMVNRAEQLEKPNMTQESKKDGQ